MKSLNLHLFEAWIKDAPTPVFLLVSNLTLFIQIILLQDAPIQQLNFSIRPAGQLVL